MRIKDLHPWDVSPQEAMEIQRRLREKLRFVPLEAERVRWVAGADVSFDKGSDTIFAAVVVLELPQLTPVDEATAITVTRFPYIPGLLSFREAPAVLKAFEKVTRWPEAVLLDGQGLAHPRRMGLACHLGLLLDLPAVGCAKSLLVGTYEEPAPQAGSFSPLWDRGEVVGAALRTRDHTSPIFVSPGHKIDLESAIRLVLRCVAGHRQPEPTRQAHVRVNHLRRGESPDSFTGRLF